MHDIMARSVIKVHTETDQEEVAELAARYNLLAVPVTDEANRLVGIVTLVRFWSANRTAASVESPMKSNISPFAINKSP